MKFKSKPVTIEAVQYTAQLWQDVVHHNLGEIEAFCPVAKFDAFSGSLYIETLEGTMRALPGDWIIKGLKGEFYPCKPDVFEAKYEPLSETKEPARCAACPGTEGGCCR